MNWRIYKMSLQVLIPSLIMLGLMAVLISLVWQIGKKEH